MRALNPATVSPRSLAQAPARAAMFLIELYRTWVSPARPPTCRYTPTCSEYAVTALTEWGLLRGLALASWRLLKCGPWTRGGWDPVPHRHGRERRASTRDTDVGHTGTDPDEPRNAPHAPASAQRSGAGDNGAHRVRPPRPGRTTPSGCPQAHAENRRA